MDVPAILHTADQGSDCFPLPRVVVVTRHPAVLEWLAKYHPQLVRGSLIIEGNATPADVECREVVGNIPLALAARTTCVHAVEFAGPPPRGQEYTLADMESAGARLSTYTVERHSELDPRREEG